MTRLPDAPRSTNQGCAGFHRRSPSLVVGSPQVVARTDLASSDMRHMPPDPDDRYSLVRRGKPELRCSYPSHEHRTEKSSVRMVESISPTYAVIIFPTMRARLEKRVKLLDRLTSRLYSPEIDQSVLTDCRNRVVQVGHDTNVVGKNPYPLSNCWSR